MRNVTRWVSGSGDQTDFPFRLFEQIPLVDVDRARAIIQRALYLVLVKCKTDIDLSEPRLQTETRNHLIAIFDDGDVISRVAQPLLLLVNIHFGIVIIIQSE